MTNWRDISTWKPIELELAKRWAEDDDNLVEFESGTLRDAYLHDVREYLNMHTETQ